MAQGLRAAQAQGISGISRAQAYAAGIALATGVMAGCGGSDHPIDVPPPPPPTIQGNGKVLLMAVPTEGENLEIAGEDENAAREREEEQKRMEEMKARQREQEQWERERSGRSCSTDWLGRTICPPYGCVFPDDACDVLRV